MFTLWYAHLFYKEYRNIWERLYKRQPLSIEAPNNETQTDQDPDDVMRFRGTPPEEWSGYIPLIPTNPIVPTPDDTEVPEMNISGSDDEDNSFHPLATSSPLLRSVNTSPVIEEEDRVSIPNMDPVDSSVAGALLPEVISEVSVPIIEVQSDSNSTPSFSNISASSDPNLVIIKPVQNNLKLKQTADSQKFLEAEGETSAETQNKAKANVDADEVDDEEDDSEIDDEEEENSVISSAPSNVPGTKIHGTGSSVEVINQKTDEAD